MATDALNSSRASAGVAQALDGLEHARARTFALVAHLDDEQLERVHSPIMSPLVWDLGHIAAYEDLWLAHRLGGLELLRPDLAALYDAFETPRAVRGDIETLGPTQARDYLAAVRARTAQALAERGVDDGVVCEMVIRHELQHGETMRQTLALAGLLSKSDARAGDLPLEQADADGWLDVAAGPFTIGAPAEGFAYDNERPQHEVHTDDFEIARLPATNAVSCGRRQAGSGCKSSSSRWIRRSRPGIHRRRRAM
jgi:iron(II)-dependent oxidoreductase